MESVQAVKQRFELIGNDVKLNRALEKAIQVAATDISVLVTGESGVGKEAIPKIIHSLSHRKHSKYIAVNCGAIPEGTIDSELFGHEKGSFTGATQTRSGYFEVADGGTIFLDEVGELPLTTQVRLLRVLENGEFLKVGSSKVQKTDVRIVAATNVNMFEAIEKEKFREDLYYRLSTVEINLPPLRERKEDIHLLFRKFASDFGQKYKMPVIRLEEDALQLLLKYRWPGNIRQLRNIAEQISVLESNRSISGATLASYLPELSGANLPAVVGPKKKESDFSTEREILYKVLFDMKSDLNDLKKLTLELMNTKDNEKVQEENQGLIRKIYGEEETVYEPEEDENFTEILHLPEQRTEPASVEPVASIQPVNEDRYHFAEEIQEEETLSLQEKEIELIKKSLERHGGKRKAAAQELGISERTLYRKIKQYDL
jgi:transcriptional regulator with PAS, ATPase and Fis domain